MEKLIKHINDFKISEPTHTALMEMATEKGVHLYQLLRYELDQVAKKHEKLKRLRERLRSQRSDS